LNVGNKPSASIEGKTSRLGGESRAGRIPLKKSGGRKGEKGGFVRHPLLEGERGKKERGEKKRLFSRSLKVLKGISAPSRKGEKKGKKREMRSSSVAYSRGKREKGGSNFAVGCVDNHLKKKGGRSELRTRRKKREGEKRRRGNAQVFRK